MNVILQGFESVLLITQGYSASAPPADIPGGTWRDARGNLFDDARGNEYRDARGNVFVEED